jgi:hypothetical protein
MLWSNETDVLDCNVMSGCECSTDKDVLDCNVMSGCECSNERLIAFFYAWDFIV